MLPRTRVLGLAAAAAAMAAAAAAQQPLGATFQTAVSTASRGGLLSASGILVARFDHDDYVGWGRTTATPNRRVIHGVRFTSEDKDGSTPESYSILVFQEDPAAPGYPETAAPLLSLGPFTNPARPAGVAQFQPTHLFPNPLEVPADRDVFVGIALPPAPNWPTDGHTIACMLGQASRWPVFDAPGSSPIQHGSYALAVDANGTRFYNSRRQLLLDLLCMAPGGACTAVTNQANHPAGNQQPGGGGYLSGLHPDAVVPPVHAGRADDPGFVFLDTSLPAGTPVFFVTDFGAFGTEQPLRNFVPGSVGAFCLKSSSITVGLRQLQGGQASLVIPIGTGVRSVLAGLPLLHQAIALGPNSGLFASPCGRQQL